MSVSWILRHHCYLFTSCGFYMQILKRLFGNAFKDRGGHTSSPCNPLRFIDHDEDGNLRGVCRYKTYKGAYKTAPGISAGIRVYLLRCPRLSRCRETIHGGKFSCPRRAD